MATANLGFSVDIDLVKAYHVFNKDRKELYLVTKYSADEKKLILEEKGPAKKKQLKTYAEKNKHFVDLVSKLPDNEIRFVPILIEYKDAKGSNQTDILLIIWTPDGVNIMKTMEIDKHKPIILRCLSGIKECLILKSKDDLNLDKLVKDKLKGNLD